ncbi:MAG: hypothetical protein IKD68_13330 [Solobacterium sp.]|nr:hypothetical protein [Solobacterium sp.]
MNNSFPIPDSICYRVRRKNHETCVLDFKDELYIERSGLVLNTIHTKPYGERRFSEYQKEYQISGDDACSLLDQLDHMLRTFEGIDLVIDDYDGELLLNYAGSVITVPRELSADGEEVLEVIERFVKKYISSLQGDIEAFLSVSRTASPKGHNDN